VTRAKVVVTGLGIAISAAFLSYALLNLDWAVFARAMSSISYEWVVASVAVLFSTMILRATRWHIITGLPAGNWIDVWGAASVGYLGTAILPARAGELLRVVRLQRLPNISPATVVGSSIIDRIFDGLGLCLLIGPTLVLVASQSEISQYLVIVASLFAVLATLATFFVVFGGRIHFETRLRSIEVVQRWYREAHSGLQPLRKPRTLMILFFLLVTTSALDVSACWLLFLAFSWSLPFSAALVFLVLLSVATALPSTPGYVGVYQIAAMAALQGYGVDGSEAVAFGTVLQIASFLLFVIVGVSAYRKRPRGSSVSSQIVRGGDDGFMR